MAYPAVLSAVKLFLGLEGNRDSMGRQLNDDTEYILQSALTSICFGYSWGANDGLETGLSAYGLTGELCRGGECPEKDFIRVAAGHILSGYPVLILPREYAGIILAVGFSHQGKVLKGLPFLGGAAQGNLAFAKRSQYLRRVPDRVRDSHIRQLAPGTPIGEASRDGGESGRKAENADCGAEKEQRAGNRGCQRNRSGNPVKAPRIFWEPP